MRAHELVFSEASVDADLLCSALGWIVIVCYQAFLLKLRRMPVEDLKDDETRVSIGVAYEDLDFDEREPSPLSFRVWHFNV